MDRLPIVMARVTVAGAITLVCGCGGGDGGEKKAPVAAGRVNAVAAEQGAGPKLDEFCDVLADPSQAKKMQWPQLAAGSAPTGGWRWVNVWATWCKPCVAELPMLQDWRTRLQGDGIELELVLLSVDGDEATVTGFREKHAKIPETLRIADATMLGDWLQSIGLDESATLPIHIFVDPDDRIRCVRMSEVSDGDYSTVKKVAQR